jgi:5-methylthioadenosine/S-adenosylhomocysteine deaminase
LSSLLVHSGTLVCMDPAGTIARGDLLACDGRIVALGAGVPAALAALPGGRADLAFDASGAFVLPGFVQAHLHLCQVLFRGLAEQTDLLRWLRERIWPLEAAHSEASIAASARLGLVESLAAGVTCVNDMGTVRHTDAIGAVLEESGVRAVFGKALMDQGEGVPAGLLESPRAALDEAASLARRWHGAAGGRLRSSVAPRFILSCSDGLWREATALSAERGLLLHTHLSESPSEGRAVEAAVGRTATRAFAARGVLGERFVGAHGVWLDDEELGLLAEAGAALVHCPGANLKLGSGLAQVRRWKDHGLRAGLGSDGAPCNNRLDPFHEMSLAAGLSRALHPERPLTAAEVLALATTEGARALGWADEIGSLEVGKSADLAVVDHGAPHHGPEPLADPCTTLVHTGRADDVRLTVVAGRVLYRDGAWATLDADRVLGEAAMERAGALRRAESHGMRR